MKNITLSIPDSLHEKLRTRNEMKWSEIIRRIIQKNLEQMEIMDSIMGKHNLTEKDIEEIAKKINSNVAKKLGLK